MKEIIHKYLQKGKDGLDRDIRYIKEENIPSLIKEIKGNNKLKYIFMPICVSCFVTVILIALFKLITQFN